jgi:flagellar FliL protein
MKGGKKILLLGGVVAGLGVAAGLVYVFVLSGPSAPPPGIPDPQPGQYGVMLALENRVVNLIDGGAYRYAKVGVTIEIRPEKADFYLLKGEARKVPEDEAIKGFNAAIPLLLDAVGRVVGSKTSDELGTPEGRDALKTELHEAVAKVIGEEEVLDVYFTDLVMQ